MFLNNTSRLRRRSLLLLLARHLCFPARSFFLLRRVRLRLRQLGVLGHLHLHLVVVHEVADVRAVQGAVREQFRGDLQNHGLVVVDVLLRADVRPDHEVVHARFHVTRGDLEVLDELLRPERREPPGLVGVLPACGDDVVRHVRGGD